MRRACQQAMEGKRGGLLQVLISMPTVYSSGMSVLGYQHRAINTVVTLHLRRAVKTGAQRHTDYSSHRILETPSC